MGPKVAGDEVIQAEPSWEAAGWGLHARVKAGGLGVDQLLLCVLSSQASRWRGLRTPGRARASLRGSCLARPQRTLGEGGQGEVRVVPFALVTGSGLAPLGCAPKKEEGDPRGGSWGLGRARGGRTVIGALAGGRRSVSRCDPHRGPG